MSTALAPLTPATDEAIIPPVRLSAVPRVLCAAPKRATTCSLICFSRVTPLTVLSKILRAGPVSEDSFTDSTLMDKWYSDHDMHMMYVGEIVEVTAR